MCRKQKSANHVRYRYVPRTGIAEVIFVVYLEEWYTIDLIESECTVVNHKTDYQETCNGDAKKTCKGKEKCLKIFVSFKDHDWNDRMAKLFFSEEYLSENDECSFSECETRMKEESTENDYFDFRNTYTKTGTTFRCFYHPKNEQAVLSRKHKRKVAWKAIVIPIIYFVIEICLYSRKRQNTRPTDIVTPL
ncbi:uncharacterized protein [Antedon mediterranea]|uniref:uncharacterized protein n=1 Tax=Antedon mediterranea TaxID=105859 RepID=UPI003AF6A3A6